MEQTVSLFDGVEFKAKGSDGTMRTVTVRKAKRGAHAGEFYFGCSCIAGKFAWKADGYHACKHVKRVLAGKLAGYSLVDSHLVAPVAARLAKAA